MPKKTYLILTLVVLLSFALAGCTLKASTPPPSVQAAAEETQPFPALTEESLVSEIIKATQTAAALGQQAEATKAPKSVEKSEPKPVVKPTEKVAKDSDSEEDNDASSYEPNPNPPRPATYTLQAGEWPYCIARRYNLDIGALLSLNGLGNDSRPPAGTVLTIPQSGTWNAGDRAWHSHPTRYTVQSGDTLNTIACYFGNLLPEDIMEANGLTSKKLNAGEVLQIP